MPQKLERKHIEGLVQERRNTSALAMELRLPYIDPSICTYVGIAVSADDLAPLDANMPTHALTLMVVEPRKLSNVISLMP